MILQFLGHASFKLKTKHTVCYIDPYVSPEVSLEKADLILISHDDFDHFSEETIKRIETPETIVVSSPRVCSRLYACQLLRPHFTKTFRDFSVTATELFHKGQPYGIGFIIKAEDKTIYFTSDTEFKESLSKHKADILIISVSGTTTMNYKKAAEFSIKLQPKIAIPMHFGKIEGHQHDAEYFKELVEAHNKTEVRILNKGEEILL
ncbi:MBL fold metallo-hydrolase [Candidatus Woesearchaeota archaeon]|nr:MBL fold metallo-hydrolase [Candidatus Woesearchaeota archaeon]